MVNFCPNLFAVKFAAVNFQRNKKAVYKILVNERCDSVIIVKLIDFSMYEGDFYQAIR